MATILLVVIFIAFIGLGIPDSLLGAAWPAMNREFGVPLASASYVTLIISGGTVVASLISDRLIRRLGTGWVTVLSTALTAGALLGFSLSHNLLWLCLFAVPLGLGAGAIDCALNNYVALHYRATHMNFLHCFYGIGVSLSPYLMSLALADAANWRKGYHIVFFFQLAITAVTLLALPLWKRLGQSATTAAAPETQRLTFGQILKIPTVRLVWLIFFGSCAIEYVCGTWGSSYLVNAKGVAVDTAARIITFYYVGMALGRFLSGVLANRVPSWALIRWGQALVLVAIALLFLPLPPAVAGASLFLIGLGNGPVFPNLLHLTPRNFGEAKSQSIMGTQMAASYIGIMFMPPLFGLLAQRFSVTLFPYFLLALFVAMIAAAVLLIRSLKQQGRY